jgi:hypothetical protein
MLPLHQRDKNNRLQFSFFPIKSFLIAECNLKMVESRGVEPHPILHQDPVFKAGRGTNSPALLSNSWWVLMVTLHEATSLLIKPTVLQTAVGGNTHILLVEDSGIEPLTVTCKATVFPIIPIPLYHIETHTTTPDPARRHGRMHFYMIPFV